MTALPKSKHLFFLAALVCVALMGSAFFLQYIEMLEPCPLCISQRIVIFILFIVAVLAVIHSPGCLGYRVYGGVAALFASMGVALASRQLWIQSLPPNEVPACMAGLEYVFDVLPLSELVKIMLTGTGDCAQVQWVFIGLTIPGWTLLIFIGFTIYGLFEVFRSK
ncbi:MAG: disulfide bond formation protein B [Candidatus Endonucleobacter bathymodioli]|uniref:Disulfide bond formation protein B n=1 Tax=Candidatus Endonucleibacter bathymodioli TaxID=539814 RepID=A0AA90NU31_9GAMM|nr:disulfide bond formation protein B [Candidatus Endonucleobacter bathymodioli]